MDQAGEISLKSVVTTTASSDVINVVNQIASRLVALNMADLDQVSEFVEILETSLPNEVSDAMASAMASEAVLAKYWNTPEEDAAWADILEETL
jgi:hypothetical protein